MSSDSSLMHSLLESVACWKWFFKYGDLGFSDFGRIVPLLLWSCVGKTISSLSSELLLASRTAQEVLGNNFLLCIVESDSSPESHEMFQSTLSEF
ncbi:hypothetical protein GDO78_019051 [Eleutherodactylus coqui]|uniref:Uncharacterized protein n=1 Tax=Eleutherodactylus coqui TaxID=57060 RepID=A0A8J6AZ80_ELECQ|nr:hypothetical protein GDO78_019051 [Eleutherodactylus coqui]